MILPKSLDEVAGGPLELWPATSIEDKAASFPQAALETGGTDNITLVLAQR